MLGTNNAGKVEEFRAILKDLDLRLLSPAMLGIEMDVVEDGQTYAENARLKAIAFSRESGLPCLADDSGLEVVVLNGAPGLNSHRFAPKAGATDADRREYLLEILKGKKRPWTARFLSTIALAVPDGEVNFATGMCTGEIIPEERGNNGFGYDPIFLFSKLGKTMAELDPDVKNRISHRAIALENAREMITEIPDIS